MTVLQQHLLRPEEWAQTVGVSRSKAYRLIKDGLPVVMVGAAKRIDPNDALAWLKSNDEPLGQGRDFMEAVMRSVATSEHVANHLAFVPKVEPEAGEENSTYAVELIADGLREREERLAKNAVIIGFSVTLHSSVVETVGRYGEQRQLTIKGVVNDRETGEQLQIERSRILATDDPVSPHELRDECMALLMHEVEERICVGDSRPLDPHKEP